MQHKFLKRFVSLALILAMMFTMFPFTPLAADENTTFSNITSTAATASTVYDIVTIGGVKYVTGIETGSKLADIKTKLADTMGASAGSEIIVVGGVVGTGAEIRLVSSANNTVVYDKATLAVKWDVTGDGKCGLADLNKVINTYIAGTLDSTANNLAIGATDKIGLSHLNKLINFYIGNYTLTINSNGGTITAGTSAQYSAGEIINISASPNPGYEFVNWTSTNGGSFGNANNATTTFTMPAGNTTVTANFTPTSGGDDFSLYSITDIATPSVGNVVSIEATATGACYLDIKILSDVTGISTDWKSGNNIANGRTQINTAIEKEFVDVHVSSALPKYFVTIAVLVDENGNQLCEPYIFLENTKAYEEYEAKTVNDFISARVIDLGGTDNDNFVVLKKGIPKITAGENGKNLLDASGSESGTYIFTNADSPITTLNVGDSIVVINDDRSQVYLIKVTSIVNSNGTVTITTNAKPIPTEFFDFININISSILDNANTIVDMSNADPSVELLDDPNDPRYDITIDHGSDFNNGTDAEINQNPFMAVEPSGIDLGGIDVDGSFSKSFSFGIKYDPDIIDTDTVKAGFELSGKVTGTMEFKLKIVYDVILFGNDYFQCKATVGGNLEMKGELKAKGSIANKSKTFTLGYLHVPTPIAGVTVGMEVTAPVRFEGSAGVVALAKTSLEVGFTFGTSGFQPIFTKSFEKDVKMEGEATLTIGPKLMIGFDALFRSMESDFYIDAGVEIKGTASSHDTSLAYTAGGDDKKHVCAICVDGSISPFIKTGFEYNVSLFGINDLTWNQEYTFGEWRATKAAFFVSLVNSPESIYKGQITFGFGSCQNKVSKTTFDPQDGNGNTVNNAVIKVKNSITGADVFTVTGKYTQYMYPGNYVASVTGGSLTFLDKNFTVGTSPQTVVITPSVSGILTGDVKDANHTAGIPNAAVNVYSGSTLIQTVFSNAMGHYSITLPAGNYSLRISAVGYLQFNCNVTVVANQNTYNETFLLIDDTGDPNQRGKAGGIIRNATTNSTISGVTINIRAGWNSQTGNILATISTNSSGYYEVELPLGNYTIEMSHDGFIRGYLNIIVQATPTLTQNGTITPLNNSGDYQIVLTWGANPRDLDAHLVGTLASGKNFHVYYGNKNGYDGTTRVANLDVDNTSGSGQPETITLTTSAGSSYFYYVYLFAGNGSIPTSGAQVRVYRGNELINTFNVPTEPNSSRYWNVFELKDGVIRSINTFSSSASPNSAIGINAATALIEEQPTDVLKDYEIAEIIENRQQMYGVLLDEAKSIIYDQYTEESVSALQTSIEYAEKLMTDPYALDADVEQSFLALQEAIDNLELKDSVTNNSESEVAFEQTTIEGNAN